MVIRWCDFKPGENLNWNWARNMKISWKSSETDDRFARRWAFAQRHTRPEWKIVKTVDCAGAKNSSQQFTAEWKALEGEKCYVWVEEFFVQKEELYGTFYDESSCESLFPFAKFFHAAQLMIRWIKRARLSTLIQLCIHTDFLFSRVTRSNTQIYFSFSISSRNYYTNFFFQCDKNTRETLFVERNSKKVFISIFFSPGLLVRW